MRVSKACWLSFMDWLNADSAGGPAGTLPITLLLTLGPVWRLVPLARQGAEAVGPWLVALLEARQRAGLALPDAPEIIAQDLLARPLTQTEAQRETAAWAQWHLEADLLRLVRLVEAPMTLLYRRDWPQWEVRYWALVVTLARIGQHYAALARLPGSNPRQHLLASAEVVWQHATQPPPQAA